MLPTRKNLIKERKILSQEVEFLRKQLIPKIPSEPVTPFVETASYSIAQDPGRMTEEKERDVWCVAPIDLLWTLFTDLCLETNWRNVAYENDKLFNMNYYYHYFYHLLAPDFQKVVRSFLYIYAGSLLLLFFCHENVYFKDSKKEKKRKEGAEKRISFYTNYCLPYFNASYTS